MYDFMNDPQFEGLIPLEKRALLSSPTMHGEELEYMTQACESGWMTTLGENIDSIEQTAAAGLGVNHAVALSCGTAALHLAVKLAAEKLYRSATGTSTPDGRGYGGSLLGRRVFVSDLTFSATVNPIVYEGGEPVFIDSEYETWNMDPEALERAFGLYPDVKLVVLVHLYGTPGRIRQIMEICRRHGALLIEDAAESLGAAVDGKMTGSFGDYGAVSFNGNKIITGSAGGMLLAPDKYSAARARKWSTQSREDAPWYEHEELGYNYRMSNVVAGVIRGQWQYLGDHIRRKRSVYHTYKEGLKGLPLTMNPAAGGSICWLSCILVDKKYMARTVRSGRRAVYIREAGRSCPTEVLEALAAFHAEGRPVWKPMHLQPVYHSCGFVTTYGNGSGKCSADTDMGGQDSVSADLFERGLCLPSDIKMDTRQQELVIDVIRRCFQ